MQLTNFCRVRAWSNKKLVYQHSRTAWYSQKHRQLQCRQRSCSHHGCWRCCRIIKYWYCSALATQIGKGVAEVPQNGVYFNSADNSPTHDCRSNSYCFNKSAVLGETAVGTIVDKCELWYDSNTWSYLNGSNRIQQRDQQRLHLSLVGCIWFCCFQSFIS